MHDAVAVQATPAACFNPTQVARQALRADLNRRKPILPQALQCWTSDRLRSHRKKGRNAQLFEELSVSGSATVGRSVKVTPFESGRNSRPKTSHADVLSTIAA